ncbi:MAG: flagellar hook-basal body complex protein FliE [Armatimonadota bacterium]|jgi:flagellar hook-basal body complex protein FliE
MRVDSSFIPLPVQRPETAPAADGVRVGGGGGGFAEVLREALARVNETQQAADSAVRRVATGDADDLHTAIIALEKADLTLRLTAQMTQRAVEAYKEISRMQL